VNCPCGICSHRPLVPAFLITRDLDALELHQRILLEDALAQALADEDDARVAELTPVLAAYEARA
jgi:hypothetical protein